MVLLRVGGQRVEMLVLKYSRQPTEKTLDGSKPERNPGQPEKRRREEMLTKFFVKMQDKMQDEKGQGLVEYSLIVVLISVVSVVALGILGVSVNSVFVAINGLF
jgi:Flp pilus assembly pilin Flp